MQKISGQCFYRVIDYDLTISQGFNSRQGVWRCFKNTVFHRINTLVQA